MNKIKKIILDLIGIGFAIIAVVTGIFILEGQAFLGEWICKADMILKSNDGILIYYLTISGIAIGVIAIIVGIILIIISFKDKSFVSLSILIWSTALLALGIILYSLIKFSDNSFVEGIIDNLDYNLEN